MALAVMTRMAVLVVRVLPIGYTGIAF